MTQYMSENMPFTSLSLLGVTTSTAYIFKYDRDP